MLTNTQLCLASSHEHTKGYSGCRRDDFSILDYIVTVQLQGKKCVDLVQELSLLHTFGTKDLYTRLVQEDHSNNPNSARFGCRHVRRRGSVGQRLHDEFAFFDRFLRGFPRKQVGQYWTVKAPVGQGTVIDWQEICSKPADGTK